MLFYDITSLLTMSLFSLILISASTGEINASKSLKPNEVMSQKISNDSFKNVVADLSLIELRGYPNLPLGASKDFPRTHIVTQIRFENLSIEPIEISSIDLKIKSSQAGTTVLQKQIGLIKLEGLEIFRQGITLTRPDLLSNNTKIQAVVSYKIRSKIYFAKSKPRNFQY
jgi:hypothetical protein